MLKDKLDGTEQPIRNDIRHMRIGKDNSPASKMGC
jgi:hypothetical protein